MATFFKNHLTDQNNIIGLFTILSIVEIKGKANSKSLPFSRGLLLNCHFVITLLPKKISNCRVF